MAGERDLNKLVAKVTAEVLREVEIHEAEAFKVSDLRTELESLGDTGSGSAWKISYDTSDGRAIGPIGNGAIRAPSAWKISYDTSDRTVLTKDQL